MSAQLTILGDQSAPSQPVMISSLSPDLISITGAPPLELGAPVKILQGDRLILGLAIESWPNGSATIKIIHVLNNLSELTRLAAQFASEPTLS